MSSEHVLDGLLARHAYDADPLEAAAVGEDGEGVALIETLGDEDSGYALVEDRAAIAPALRELGPRDRAVLGMRFAGEMTQSQIAATIGVSQMQVSRMLASAISRLQELCGVEDPP